VVISCPREGQCLARRCDLPVVLGEFGAEPARLGFDLAPVSA
jgi:hypothetical protein